MKPGNIYDVSSMSIQILQPQQASFHTLSSSPILTNQKLYSILSNLQRNEFTQTNHKRRRTKQATIPQFLFTMKPAYCHSHHRYRHFIVPFILLSFSLPRCASLQLHRRILHQPLFPATSPPPPPSDDQVIPPPDQPFFPEVPAGYQNQPQQPPPPPSPSQLANNGSVPIPTATQPAKPAKKVAIAISVGIVTLGMLTGFAFFLYRHRIKHPIETQKRHRSSRLNDAPPVMPSSSVLYMGTVQPARTSGEVNTPPTMAAINESAGAGDVSPYRKLSSVKRCDRYRPSPDLQPLPALPRPPSLSESIDKRNDGDDGDSSSSVSSSDEESQGTAFYTPQGSLIGNDDGYYTPAIAPISKTVNGNVNSVPFSKRTSPKSRQNERVENVDAVTSYFLKRPKFSAPPPPPPNMAILRSIRKTPPPPPPPPPAVRMSAPTTVSSSKQELKTPTLGAVFKGEESVSGGGDEEEGSKPKLKALHWDKVRATSDRVTVWDQLKSSSFQLNEDMMESLFGCNPTNTSVQKEPTSRRSVLPVFDRENRVLDPKKSQNIAILLRALNVTRDEVSEALLDGNPESLGAELLETLVKMAPTKEEEIKLRNYSGDTSKLGSAERFLKTVLDIPFAFTRVEAMLYRANFDTEVKYLRKSFQTLEEASEELKSSRLFLKLLEAVLRTGNRMNVGTNRGDAKAFKLDTLLKLVDIKGTDGKTTLLHFVVQEIIRSEGGNTDFGNENAQDSGNLKCRELQVVSGLSRDLSNVKKAAGMDSDVLSSYVSKLEKGLEKIVSVLQCEKPDMQGNFFDSMKLFLREAEEEIDRIKADERRALSLVKEATEYFHGDAAKEEAHPFRIFMIVRDFLNILDHVCKEVGKMQDKTVMGSARSFRISASASLPVLNRYNAKHDVTSDEESSSP